MIVDSETIRNMTIAMRVSIICQTTVSTFLGIK